MRNYVKEFHEMVDKKQIKVSKKVKKQIKREKRFFNPNGSDKLINVLLSLQLFEDMVITCLKINKKLKDC